VARATAALAVLALPVGAAACGGSKKSTTTETRAAGVSAARAVRDAAAKTVAAGSEHARVAAKVSVGGQDVSLSGQGDFDTAKHVGSLHADFSLAGTQSSLDEVSDGTSIYVRSPFFSAFLPAGKSWLALDLRTASSTLGAAASALLTLDPAAVVGQLKALGNVEDLGGEQLGGVQVEHYRGTIDPSKLSGSAGQAAQAAGASFGPFDVWVGGDGYVHKLRTSTSAGSSLQTAKTTLTMAFSDFGKTVSVSVPPASETVDATKVSIPGLGG
jgi:hypothetical protein